MKQAIILFTALVLSFAGFAQFPGGGMPPAQGKGMQAPPSIGIVFGKVVDSAGKPIQDASVMLMGNKMDTATKKFKQVMLKATSTKAAGSFRFEDLPLMGPLTIKISATGYAPFEKRFTIVDPKQMKPGTMPDVEKDFGKIAMNIQATEMSTITVVGKKPAMKMDIDKKVFNVEKNIVSTGGNAGILNIVLKNNAASVTLAVNDIFRTRINHQFTYSEFYNREAIRYPDNPMVRMTFSYRFGKMDMSLFKRKNMKGEAEGMQGGMQIQ